MALAAKHCKLVCFSTETTSCWAWFLSKCPKVLPSALMASKWAPASNKVLTTLGLAGLFKAVMCRAKLWSWSLASMSAPHSNKRPTTSAEGNWQIGYLPTAEESLEHARCSGVAPLRPLAPTLMKLYTAFLTWWVCLVSKWGSSLVSRHIRWRMIT